MKINSVGLYSVSPKYTKTFNFLPVQRLKSDCVQFGSSKLVKKEVGVCQEIADSISYSLSHSTSGHRAEYGSETFNDKTVNLITLGLAEYVKEESSKNSKKKPTVLIGGDTRIATRNSLPLISRTLQNQDINVIFIKDPVPSPLLALAARNLKPDLAVLMTASHNPWKDGGYNFVTNEGAIAPSNISGKIAKNISDIAKKGFYFENIKNNSTETEMYPLEMYKEHINSLDLIEWNRIKNENISIYYDGLKGTGSYVLPKLLEEYGIPLHEIHSTGQDGPNPTDANLQELKEKVINEKNKVKIGIANDGDADRFGIIDENGSFITPNDVLLLASYHLAKNKGYKGTIIRSQATTKELDYVAQKYGLDILKTPVGFKYIASDILDLRKNGKDMLIAGEESGGLTVFGHIPEKDGILADLLLLDLMAAEKKPLSELLKQVKSELPIYLGISHASKKYPTDAEKQIAMDRFISIFENAKNGNIKFDDEHDIDVEKTVAKRELMEKYREGGDGIKLFLTDGSTVLVRKSGTEPLLRYYIEASGKDQTTADKNCLSLKSTVDRLFTV